MQAWWTGWKSFGRLAVSRPERVSYHGSGSKYTLSVPGLLHGKNFRKSLRNPFWAWLWLPAQHEEQAIMNDHGSQIQGIGGELAIHAFLLDSWLVFRQP